MKIYCKNCKYKRIDNKCLKSLIMYEVEDQIEGMYRMKTYTYCRLKNDKYNCKDYTPTLLKRIKDFFSFPKKVEVSGNIGSNCNLCDCSLKENIEEVTVYEADGIKKKVKVDKNIKVKDLTGIDEIEIVRCTWCGKGTPHTDEFCCDECREQYDRQRFTKSED